MLNQEQQAESTNGKTLSSAVENATNSKSRHTKTPWKLNRGGSQIYKQLNPGGVKQIICECWRDLGAEACIANAEFICKAVNEHDTLIAQRDALLEACKGLTHALNPAMVKLAMDDGDPFRLKLLSLQTKAKAAIALCEPKEKEMV